MKRATMIFLILLMGACGERSRLEQRQAGGYQFFSRDSASVAQRARFAAAPAALEAVTVTKAVDLPPIGPSDVTNMVIRTGTAAIEVDSLEPAIAAVRALAIPPPPSSSRSPRRASTRRSPACVRSASWNGWK